MQRLTRSKAAAEAAASRAEAAAARAEALRYNFISCLILTAQNGFGQDVDHLTALCRETWGEEQWWDAVKDLPHGRVRREGPARRGAAVPFGFERGPFSAGRTHVMYAARAGDVARLAWLLARGARLELKDWAGRTALHWACAEGREATVRELLVRGASSEAVTDRTVATGFTPRGATALGIASEAGHVAVVRALLVHGASVDGAAGAYTPLLQAVVSGHLAIVHALLEHGAGVNLPESSPMELTPLLLASERCELAMVRELLSYGASVNLADQLVGLTPLMLACSNGHLPNSLLVVELLLSFGAEPRTLDFRGETALSLAQRSGHHGIAGVLSAAMAAQL